jgi:hypothetical protein
MKMKSVQSFHPYKSVIQTIYDIVKAHGGELKVETRHIEGLPTGASAKVGKEGAETTFAIRLSF